MNYQLTGNPFVDTGIYAMQAHATKLRNGEPVDELTPEVLTEVMNGEEGFGRWLAKRNRALNSFMMVCGKNSPLTNSSTNKWLDKEKKYGHLDERDSGWKDYLETLRRLHEELLGESGANAPMCESCGERPAAKTLNRPVGREFFPLAGSLGSDAQALPASSRAPRVCPLCLLAIQWLPLGGIIFDGKLACFQFTEPRLSQYFVEDAYLETSKRFDTAKVTNKVSVYGSGEGTAPAAQILIDKMSKLQDDIDYYELPSDVTLNIWAFTNSGASPDCEIIEISNPALRFLWEAAHHHKSEISELLRHERDVKSQFQLLSCIGRANDYSGFYPRKSGRTFTKPASPALYERYQTRILKRSPVALEAARNLAALVHERLSSGSKEEQKFLAQVLKEKPRWTKDGQVRINLRRLIAEFAEKGRFSFSQYAQLFPAANLEGMEALMPEDARKFWREPGAAVRPTSYGWDSFWFYLHHADNDTLNADACDAVQATNTNEDLAMFTNPKIQQFAADVFAMQLERRGGADEKRGLAYIKRNIVDGFTRGKITNATLRNWFSLLAETHSAYANEDFDALCRDELGREATNEMRFQMRLEITNLYRESVQKNSVANR